ncbi:MAG TPA: DinB family protein [Gemmatimonadales bacterium]|nr:DinB family protein [Gemmatimonadales bacterium]
MALKDALLPEFDLEMASTRKMLERAPEDAFDWKPHAKSMLLGRLATHLAQIPAWGSRALTTDSFDFAPPGAPQAPAAPLTSRAAVLALFDENVAGTRAALAQASDADLGKSWSLLRGGAVVFTMPKAAVLRTLLFSHIIHHRGQFSVYLRLRDVPVPGMYGPSADEK